MKYFVLFIGVFCEKRDQTTVKCLTDSSLVDFSPTLKYITSELKSTCQEILESHGSLSSCSPSGDNLKCATTVAVGQACPPAPKDCVLEEDKVSTNQDCEYKCTQPELSCTTPGFLVDFEHSAADTIYCFNQEINSCTNKIVDEDDRIEYKCHKDCGYNTDPGFTLVFDGTEFTNTGPDTYTFDCAESNKCDCSTNTMTCDATAYADECPDSDPKCQDGICYDAPPLFDYKFENCTITNEEEEDLENIQYCKNDVKVHFPCGKSVKNDCKEETGEINCYCDADATECAKIEDAVFENGECVIKNVKDVADKMDCESFICFDDNFENELCPSGAAVNYEYWQCFDEFTKVEIAVPEDEKSNLKAVIAPNTTYASFSDCIEPACPAGICKCGDTERDGASAFCQLNGDFYVTKIEKDEEESREDADEYEFECLSFNEEYSAINIIESDVGKESECKELQPPTPDIDAKCPALGNCNVVKSTVTGLPKVGFFDCRCDTKCSYGCIDNYEAKFKEGTFPEDWNQEEDGDVYTPYTCVEKEKDNLVMIICTSIFVPLGVAGIAAGVYFFFFHESSEVAPVETDNELASTRSSENNPTDENKEETRSEITKDN